MSREEREKLKPSVEGTVRYISPKLDGWTKLTTIFAYLSVRRDSTHSAEWRELFHRNTGKRQEENETMKALCEGEEKRYFDGIILCPEEISEWKQWSYFDDRF